MSSQNNLQYDVYNSLRENLPTIKVRDEHSDEIFEYSYQELIKYHGHYFLGGVALAYKLAAHVFGMLNEIPKRGHFYMLNGIGPTGNGFTDTMELLTRTNTYGKLSTDVSLLEGIIAPPTPRDARFYFEIGYKDSYFKVRVKENLIPANFYKYSGMNIACEKLGEVLSDENKIRLKMARKELESAVLSTSPEDLFDFIQIKIK